MEERGLVPGAVDGGGAGQGGAAPGMGSLARVGGPGGSVGAMREVSSEGRAGHPTG